MNDYMDKILELDWVKSFKELESAEDFSHLLTLLENQEECEFKIKSINDDVFELVAEWEEYNVSKGTWEILSFYLDTDENREYLVDLAKSLELRLV